jgi:hypothetical protein
MSTDRMRQSRRSGSVPSIRVLVFAVVISALMLAGTLAGLAAGAALIMTSDVNGRFTEAVAAMTASAARLALPLTPDFRGIAGVAGHHSCSVEEPPDGTTRRVATTHDGLIGVALDYR